VPDLECIEDERVIVCREAFKALTSKPLEVVITFAHEIEWPEHDYKNTRNYNVFLDLIKLCAIYEQRNREVDENNRIIANYDDFYLAASIYAPRREMNDTKLSEGPQKVFDLLIRHKDQSYTQAEIVEALKIPQASLSRYLKTLQEMSLIIEDKGVREIGCKTVEIDGMGRPKEIDDTRFTYPNVYQYKGNGIESNIYDTPLTLSLKEKAKPEYQKWLEDKI
jgi:hypothetical protein